MLKPVAISLAEPRQSLAQIVVWLGSGAGIVAYVLVMLDLLSVWKPLGSGAWTDGLLFFAATVVMLGSLLRQLPAQNVLLVAGGIAVIGGLAHWVNATVSIPFGPQTFTTKSGAQLFKLLSWQLPLLWVLALLSSRGVARLILRPWRRLRAYGFWLIGVTVVLTVAFDAALEPFATQVRGYWLWEKTRLSIDWQGVPITNFLGWTLMSLLLLAFFTPALISKQVTVKNSPDFLPLAVWVLMLIIFAVGAGVRELWVALGYCVFICFVVLIMAIRGGKT